MEFVLVVFVLLCIALAIVIAVEIREYRLYRKAALGVIALAESMQVSFAQVAEHLTRMNVQQNILGKRVLYTQQQVEFIEMLSQLHSEALNINTTGLREKHKQLEADMDGEDIFAEVQG
jgi:hypothetical protein